MAVTGYVKAQEATAPAYITFSQAVLPQGGTGEMEVYYQTDDANKFKAFQIDVPLPKGITIIENVEMAQPLPKGIGKGTYSSLGKNNYDATKKFFATANNKSDKSVVIGFQTGSETFPASSEPTLLCTLTLKAAETVDIKTGEEWYETDPLKSYIELTDASTEKKLSANQTLKIKVLKLGDVNADGEVDITDAVCIVYNDLGETPPTFYPEVGDLTNNKEVDLSDAISIVYKSLGQTSQASGNADFDEEIEEQLDPR